MPFSFLKNNTALSTFINKSRPDRYEWLLVTIVTTLLAAFLYGDTLSGYWRFDDGFHLKFAAEYSPWQYFFDPIVSHMQSGANIAPWNPFFYDVNLSLFGFEPRGFYLHILILIIATSIALHALLRIWLPLHTALLGSIFFLLGKPTLHIANELMTNHYLTGMLFSLLSLNFFIHYIRQGGRAKQLASIFLYALAMSCKEVYVPLTGILLFIPVGSYKQRFFALLPFSSVIILYALWRKAVLGGWVGGYKLGGAEKSYQYIIEQLLNIPFTLFSHHWLGVISLLIMAVMLIIALRNKFLNIPLIFVSLFLIVVPLISLIVNYNIIEAGRYFFLPWLAISILIAVIFQPLKKKKHNKLYFMFKSLSVITLIISSAVAHNAEKIVFNNMILKAEEIYHFFIDTNFINKAFVIDSHTGTEEYWTFVGTSARRVSDFSQNIVSPPISLFTSGVDSINSLILLGDFAQTIDADLSKVQFHLLQAGVFKPFEIKPIIEAHLDAIEKGKNRTINVKYSYEKGALSWEIEPKNMTYSAILWHGEAGLRFQALDWEDTGSYPWDINTKAEISISVKSPTGWIAVSPAILFLPEQGEAVWEGETDTFFVTNKLKSLLQRLE